MTALGPLSTLSWSGLIPNIRCSGSNKINRDGRNGYEQPPKDKLEKAVQYYQVFLIVPKNMHRFEKAIKQKFSRGKLAPWKKTFAR